MLRLSCAPPPPRRPLPPENDPPSPGDEGTEPKQPRAESLTFWNCCEASSGWGLGSGVWGLGFGDWGLGTCFIHNPAQIRAFFALLTKSPALMLRVRLQACFGLKETITTAALARQRRHRARREPNYPPLAGDTLKSGAQWLQLHQYPCSREDRVFHNAGSKQVRMLALSFSLEAQTSHKANYLRADSALNPKP